MVDARALTRDTGVPCVPVFWIKSEDHRFVEVASAARSSTPRGPWSPPASGRRQGARRRRRAYGPASRRRSTPSSDAGRWRPGGDGAAAAPLPARRVSARPWRGGSAASSLGTGLLVVDAGDPALAGAARPLCRRWWRGRMRSTGCWTRGKRRCRTRGSCHRCPCGRGPR
ncbi:MAG: hypothetical protein R3F43_21475 [bacterium]